jgi:hypothetical protein
MTERRAVPRHRTYLKGVLSFQNGSASEDCVVRNLSESGALIELPHPHAPETFELAISGRARASARVVWRNGGRFGVRLEAVASPKPAPRPRRPDEGY